MTAYEAHHKSKKESIFTTPQVKLYNTSFTPQQSNSPQKLLIFQKKKISSTRSRLSVCVLFNLIMKIDGVFSLSA
jgi:hypothetical protein